MAAASVAAERAAATREKYGRGIGVWLGYLDAVGRTWSDASQEDVDGFKFWRTTDAANPQRVAGASVLDNLTAISCFYEWAGSRYGVANPVAVSICAAPAAGSGWRGSRRLRMRCATVT